ncbi:hypothetical protein LGL55_15525 [Clostridium tagluense]|uniref:hypothetical protein n=1 Tax=Clostridium tagluense TaxID=360422 RepID=UPI001CF37434|nr:hypothetical protein [Clostridium tagluense]MCB2312654.1 hypothetical protein [Clostridium tagluense]MCB2317420.1 hypothetical protein [Clostridium tagluense]MCB2322231.1 hypothetical protein [Clostridium tagluense]MCB2327237.1 hypothetical protein [Clostridium tagluense]MCB2331921.1 hypothetical protein [Clostridium tagluense]
MKVTKREQMLLGVLLIMLLGYGFYKFVYTKQDQKITQLKTSRDSYSQKWEQVKAKIASKDKKNQEYKILNAKILSKTNMLFPSIEQEKIIMVLDKMIKDSNLQVEVLGFSEVSSGNTRESTSKTEGTSAKAGDKNKNAANELNKLVSDFNGTNKKDANSEKTKDSKVQASTTNTEKSTAKADNSKSIGAYKMQVTLNFKGNYDELISFIEQVEKYEKKTIVSNINLAAAEGSGVSGNLILEFYGVPKINSNDYFKWDYKRPSGKGNPFVGGSSSVDTVAVLSSTATQKQEIQYDFLMSVRPTTSDLPTVMLGKAKDSLKDTYVYADNEGEENIELYLIQIGSKYFYKYKTTRDVYPKDFNTQKEFSPFGKDIKIKIYSHIRNSGADLSGVNIKLYNKTNLEVNLDIEDDDKTKPRVKISNEFGKIKINII